MVNLYTFTPLYIYNGTLFSVPLDVKGQQLPINQLKGTPPTEECPNSNVHQCINFHFVTINSNQMKLGNEILKCSAI